MRVSTATEMFLRDHNSNNGTHSGNVCYCTYMVNTDYDKFRSFSPSLYDYFGIELAHICLEKPTDFSFRSPMARRQHVDRPGSERTLSDAERHRDDAVRARHAVQAADEVGQVVEHRQVVLHHDDVLVGGDQAADGARRLQPLLHVQVARRLVKHETASGEAGRG